MAGPLGPAAVGAGSLGQHDLLSARHQRASGCCSGMDTLVAQAFGANDVRDCRRTPDQRRVARDRR